MSSNHTKDLVGKVKDILSIYKNLDQTFGFYFVYCFTVFELTWITVLYFGVSVYFSKYEAQYALIFGAGSLTTALSGENDCSIYINTN